MEQENTLIAESTITIRSSIERVWNALTSPEMIKQYFFGVDTITDWQVGSPILYRGVWQDKPFEDKGVILKFDPLKQLIYTHWSPLSGLPDTPENYQTVTFDLAVRTGGTQVTISNDHNPNEDSKTHAEQNWQHVLKALKKLLEN